MAQPPRTIIDFQALLLQLLPPGDAWPRETTTVLAGLAEGLAGPHADLYAAAVDLLDVEADPALTTLLLPDWEASYGLPDPCTPLNPTLAQRRAALVARIAAQGGQSQAYFIAVAAALGFTVTITTFPAFVLGFGTLGAIMPTPEWQFVWQVNAPSITALYFELGASALGEPFWTVGNSELQCRLAAIAPAHTILTFSYS